MGNGGFLGERVSQRPSTRFLELKPACSGGSGLCCRSSESAWSAPRAAYGARAPARTAGTAAVGPISAVHVTLFQFIPPEPCEAGLTRPILQMKRQAQKFYPTQEHSMRMWLRQDLNPGPISLQNLCSFLCRALPFVSTIILLPTVPSYDPDG